MMIIYETGIQNNQTPQYSAAKYNTTFNDDCKKKHIRKRYRDNVNKNEA